MRRSIATVSVSGTLAEKLDAIAAAGFDAIELFDNDLLTSPIPPEEVRSRAADLGLGIDLYQPFRDFEGMPEDALTDGLHRAEHKFAVMERLGVDTMLVCSNVSPTAIGRDELAAEQLRLLAERAAEHGIRIAYEALAWGRHVNDYLHAWRIVRLADHPNLGVCLDSFHILSRGAEPGGIEAIPGDKIFFLQLADAPLPAMDVLQWSRHYRCFPGQGGFDVAGLVSHVLNTGYGGPLSLEVFNDVFRQADARRTSVDAMRSLIALEEELTRTRPPVVATGYAFAGLAVPGEEREDRPRLRDLLRALGFEPTGVHHTEPVELWEQGAAGILLDSGSPENTPEAPALTTIGVLSPDPTASADHAASLLAPTPTAGEATAPDGTRILFRAGPRWREDFSPSGPAVAGDITHIDHVALTEPWHHFDEAVLFYRTVLGLRPRQSLELPDPYGLLRSRAMSNADGSVRMALNIADVGGRHIPRQHIALAGTDIMATARRLRVLGDIVLPIPGNYYDDLEARYGIVDPELRELSVLYDRDERGEFLHLYTVTVGQVFFEIVQRIGGYEGYGAANTPIRLAVQHASEGPAH